MTKEHRKPSEPITPEQRGGMVEQFQDWAIDTILGLPEAQTALLLKFRGRKFAVDARGDGPDKLSFIRNGYYIDVSKGLRGNTPAGGGLMNGGKKLEIELEAIGPDKSEEHLHIYSTSEYAGEPISEIIEGYIDGNLVVNLNDDDILPLEVRSLEEAQDEIERTKATLSRMLGLEPEEPEDIDEAIDHQLTHTT